MTESIHQILEALPETSLTTRALSALDYLVPGEWKNITSFQAMIVDATGESDEALLQQVGEKAFKIWFDESTGYQRAVTIYQLVDAESKIAGAAALTSMASQRFQVLEFMKDLAPKPDTVQAIDAGVKFVAELAAFTSMRGLPGDSIGDFAASLAHCTKEDSMRLAAWLAFDCVLPLGPDFLKKLLDGIEGGADKLAKHSVFQKLAGYLPGGAEGGKGLIKGVLESSGDHLTTFVQSKGMTQDNLLAKARELIEVSDDKLDLVAAALDIGTSYFEHTGIQTVSRALVTRAYGEI
ncbi:hypothetical protein BH09MYX1_BH09MYX1_42200 [soil metagenome]